MKAAVYYTNSDVRMEERPKPTIGPGEILVKVRASGVCGSDVLEWYRIKKAPIVLGHEIAGDVVQVGEGVTQCRAGDRGPGDGAVRRTAKTVRCRAEIAFANCPCAGYTCGS